MKSSFNDILCTEDYTYTQQKKKREGITNKIRIQHISALILGLVC